MTIGGRRYVDGGVRSASNLDLVARDELDLVICLNPTSSRDAPPSRHPLDRLIQINRDASGRRLGHEAKAVRATGAEVLCIQPSAEDLQAMGRNLMSGARRNEVIEAARRSVTEMLRRPTVARRLAGLPAGEAHRIARPPGPVSEWPEVLPGSKPAPAPEPPTRAVAA